MQGIQKTVTHLDDIIISEQTMEKHNSNACAALKRLRDYDLKDKCEFKKSSISYRVHRIDSEWIHLTQEKVNSIRKAPTLKNVLKLRIFLLLWITIAVI